MKERVVSDVMAYKRRRTYGRRTRRRYKRRKTTTVRKMPLRRRIARVEKLIELKHRTVYNNTIINTTTPISTSLNAGIVHGDDPDQFSGNSYVMKDLYIRYQCKNVSTSVTASVRFVVVWWPRVNIGESTTFTDVFQLTDDASASVVPFTALKSKDRRRDAIILKDFSFYLGDNNTTNGKGGSSNIKVGTCYVPINRKCISDGLGDLFGGLLMVYHVGGYASQDARLDWTARMRYHDG